MTTPRPPQGGISIVEFYACDAVHQSFIFIILRIHRNPSDQLMTP